ncbi:uncharacterized protein [Leptinotarsa decemlineata]|uniref:uncharacterized protein n=1 Tax=Leptinotarsa decemlineata TaxID=7539 RepID=UPI003D30799E
MIDEFYLENLQYFGTEERKIETVDGIFTRPTKENHRSPRVSFFGILKNFLSGISNQWKTMEVQTDEIVFIIFINMYSDRRTILQVWSDQQTIKGFDSSWVSEFVG